MNNRVLVEMCCGSLEDAIIAQRAGADRIELNSSLFFGGLTPSIGTIIETKKRLDIPVMVMIRPRSGGFCYTEDEIEVMKRDIKLSLEYGADGIVFGVLKEDGTINEDACKRLIDLVGGREAVFHRAFDVVPDPFESLDILVNLGFKRILTKGQKNTVEEGGELLKELIKYSSRRICVMSGGCRPYNIEHIINDIGCSEVHVASFIKKSDPSTQVNPEVYFGSPLNPGEDSYDAANFEYLRDMRIKIDEIVNSK